MNFKRRFAILAVPAVLALGGGAVAVHAANSPNPAPATSQNESGTDNQAGEVETANQAGEVETANPAGEVETADPAGSAGTGHADPAGEVDHQATGDE